MVVIMKFLFLFYLLFVSLRIIESVPPFACDPGNGATRGFKFCSLSLSIKDRVQDLIPRLTLQEKIRLIVNNAIPIERLGLRGYEWWSEALHGVSNTGPGVRFGGNFPGATSFPQVITTAASYNDSLWTAIGKVVSTEARAMHNGGVAGLTYWSPNVNIFRDPRWGRGQETPGEDPILAGRYAASYVRGLQGGAGNYLKVAACCKHYTAYDLDSWKGHDRYHFNAQVSKQDIEEIFNVPFKACVVEGKVASVMCSYNQVNGKPTCADPSLLRDTIRGEWRLDGYIVSDCDSVGVMFNDQHFTPTPEDAAADVIRAGLDLDCGPFLAIHTEGAVKMGKLSEGEIDQALANLLTVQMRLGMFDGPRAPFSNLGPQDVCTQAHQQLAREAAQQGIVLLKNQNRALPLSTKWTIAVVGPHAEATVAMIGNYAGIPCRYTTPLDGISKYARTIQSNGCTTVSCTTPRAIPRACDAAREADATVVFVGLSQEFEREALDRTGLFFPGYQQELVSLVARDSKGPVVLVILSGGPIDITFAKNDPKVSAILWAGYPGEAGGLAIADVLFGAANPGGKLPMTWYPGDYVNKVQMTDMAMRADNSRGFPGRTYRFYKGPVVYPFGFGLSYTNFRESVALAPRKVVVPVTPHNFTSFEAIAISNAHCDSVKVPLDIEVENVGDKDGSHTVMVFSKTRDKRLIAFKKVHIFSGGKHRVRLDIDACEHLSEVDEFGVRRIPMGKHILQVGQHVTHSFKVLHKTIINH